MKSLQAAILSENWAILLLGFAVCCATPANCWGVDFVSSEFDLSARAEASNVPADEFDVDTDSAMQTNLHTYDDAVAATATTSTASSSSNVIFEASFTPTLITVDASGTAEANGGADHPASAFASGDVTFVFSTPVAVDYSLRAGLSGHEGDANLFLLLRDQSDSSLVFLSEVFASGFEEPAMAGTLAPGVYELSTGISPSAFADEFGGVSSTNASLFVELGFEPVPEPSSFMLLALIIAGAVAQRWR